MLHPAQALLWGFAALALYAIGKLHLWRALIFVRPGLVKVKALPELQPTRPATLEKATALVALGFRPLGGHREQAPLGPSAELLDFAHPSGAFASVLATRRGAELFFLSRTGDGGLVVSADHFRPVGAAPGLQIAGIPGWKPERLFLAHRGRVERVQPAPPADPPPATRAERLEERVRLAREWYRGAGAREVRALHLSGLVWIAGTVGLVAWVLLG